MRPTAPTPQWGISRQKAKDRWHVAREKTSMNMTTDCARVRLETKAPKVATTPDGVLVDQAVRMNEQRSEQSR